MTNRIQNINLASANANNSVQVNASAVPLQINRATLPVFFGQARVATPVSDTFLARLNDTQFLTELRRNPTAPANTRILQFVQYCQQSHSVSELAAAKMNLMRDLMRTQNSWVSDVLQISSAVSRTIGGALMTSNFLTEEWAGNNQQQFERALFHLNDECQSWINRMGHLFNGSRHNFDTASQEAAANDAALSVIRDLAQAELRQLSSTRNPLEHEFYSQLLRHEIPEASGTQQLASTLRSHSIIFARNSAEAATGVFGALACFGALRMARALTSNKISQTILNGALNGFLQVALQTPAHQGFAAMLSGQFVVQSAQAFATGAACGVTGSLVNAGFGRLLGSAVLASTDSAGERVFRWATARLLQRAVVFGSDIETEVRMDHAMSAVTGRRNIHNRLQMGQQVETTAFWERVVNSAGELSGDTTTHAYTSAATSAYRYTQAAQQQGPQVLNAVLEGLESIFRGPPGEGQLAFAGCTFAKAPVSNFSSIEIVQMSSEKEESSNSNINKIEDPRSYPFRAEETSEGIQIIYGKKTVTINNQNFNRVVGTINNAIVKIKTIPNSAMVRRLLQELISIVKDHFYHKLGAERFNEKITGVVINIPEVPTAEARVPPISSPVEVIEEKIISKIALLPRYEKKGYSQTLSFILASYRNNPDLLQGLLQDMLEKLDNGEPYYRDAVQKYVERTKQQVPLVSSRINKPRFSREVIWNPYLVDRNGVQVLHPTLGEGEFIREEGENVWVSFSKETPIAVAKSRVVYSTDITSYEKLLQVRMKNIGVDGMLNWISNILDIFLADGDTLALMPEKPNMTFPHRKIWQRSVSPEAPNRLVSSFYDLIGIDPVTFMLRMLVGQRIYDVLLVNPRNAKGSKKGIKHEVAASADLGLQSLDRVFTTDVIRSFLQNRPWLTRLERSTQNTPTVQVAGYLYTNYSNVNEKVNDLGELYVQLREGDVDAISEAALKIKPLVDDWLAHSTRKTDALIIPMIGAAPLESLARQVVENNVLFPWLSRPENYGQGVEGLTAYQKWLKVNESLKIDEKYKVQIRGKPVLLIDDNITDGITYMIARRILLEAGATEVGLVTLTRTIRSVKELKWLL